MIYIIITPGMCKYLNPVSICNCYLNLYCLVCSILLAPPRFDPSPTDSGGCPSFNSQSITLGDSGNNPTCTLCVHCFVTGTPSPVVTWEYNGGPAGYVSVLTNQSNHSSAFFTQSNGQVNCENASASYVHVYHLYFLDVVF